MPDAVFAPFPTVQPTGAPSDYQKVNVNPEEFGSQVGQATEQAGAKTSAVGGEIFGAAMARAELDNELWANDQNTQATKKMGQRFGEYSALEGQNAKAGLNDFQNSITDIYKEALAAAPNMKARSMLSASMRYMGDRYINYGQMHANEQTAKWEHQSTLDSADQHADQAMIAALNDDKKGMDVSLQAGLGQQDKIAEQYGLDDISRNGIRSRYLGEKVSKIVEAVAAGGNMDKAQAIFSQYKDQMDVNGIAAVERFLRPIIKEQQATVASDAATKPTYGSAPAGFSKVEQDNGNPEGFLTGTFGLESNYGRDVGTGEKFKGPFQLSNEIIKRYGVTDPMDLAQSAKATAEYARDNAKIMTPAINHTPDATELYIAHQQGAGGAIKMINSPDATAADTIGLENVKGNLPKAFAGVAATITNKQFIDYYAAHFEGASPATTTMVPESIAMERLQSTPALMADPALMTAAVSKMKQSYTNFNMENQAQIATLNANVPVIIQQLYDGVDVPDSAIPYADMQNYTPGKAAIWLPEIEAAKKIGVLAQAYKWASNDEVNGALLSLKANHGPINELIAQSAKGSPEEFFKLQTAATTMFQRELDKRQKALLGPDSDSAGYSLGNPGVNAAAQKAHATNSPDDGWNYAIKTIQLQAAMGVPQEFVHVLPKQEAQHMVEQVTANVGQADQLMQIYAKQWGDAWPQVFSDLHTLGKLPTEFAGIHVLEDPTQKAIFVKALQEQKKDGFNWDTALGSGDRGAGRKEQTTLETTVLAGLQPYLSSLDKSGTSEAEKNEVIKQVNLLAYGNQYFNQDADAAGKAVKAFIGRYSYVDPGGARVETKYLDTVKVNATNMREQLTSSDIQLPNDIGRAGQQSVDAYMAQLKASGEWVTSRDGGSLILKDQYWKTVNGNDGKPLQVMIKGAQSYSPNFKPRAAEGSYDIVNAYKNSLNGSGQFTPEQIDTMTDAYAKDLHRRQTERTGHVR